MGYFRLAFGAFQRDYIFKKTTGHQRRPSPMSKERATILNNLSKPALIGIMLACLVGVFLVQGKLNT